MKLLISVLAITGSTLVACQSKNENAEKTISSDTALASTTRTEAANTQAISTEQVIAAYLSLKNSLTADNSIEAATAGKSLSDALKTLPANSLTAMQLTDFEELKQDMIEHTDHIATKSADIKHQREHFQELSDGMYELVKAAGTNQILYKDYCPMVKANWLSETKEIQNPYYGTKSDMATCGEVKETLGK